jgi:pimeloyl-ACP methyl ester carboxylesterase
MLNTKYLFKAAVLLLVLMTSQVIAQENPTIKRIGSSTIEYFEIGVYDKAKLEAIHGPGTEAFMNSSPFSKKDLRRQFDKPMNGVRLFKVRYGTTIPELGGKPTIASGLIAIPDNGLNAAPMISYQHGTVFEKDSVPSSPEKSFEMQLILATFAAQGYVAIGTDYIGLGDSKEANTYGQSGASVQAALDMLYAARAILEAEGRNSTHLFLQGWSQGAYNTLQFLRRLEMIGEKVDAAAVASPPTDIRMWLSRLMINRQSNDAPWVVATGSNLIMAADAYAISGFARQVIKPQYLEAARQFFSFEIGVGEFMSKTPTDPKEFFQEDFLETAVFGNSLFWFGAERGEAYRWATKTPLHVYFGENDEVIPTDIAKLPQVASDLFGGKTKTFSAGPKADHRGTYLFSLIETLDWHKEIMKR